MKRVIRHGVFETNSSSSHSVSIVGGDGAKGYRNMYFCVGKEDLKDPLPLTVDPELNKVKVRLGEFGWGPEAYNSMYAKLSYLLTMIAMSDSEIGRNQRRVYDVAEYFNLPGYKMVNDYIAKKYNCDGVFITNNITLDKYIDCDYGSLHIEPFACVDHQSCFDTLEDFFNAIKMDIDEFITNKDVVLFIYNDNSDMDDIMEDAIIMKEYLDNQDKYDEEFK